MTTSTSETLQKSKKAAGKAQAAFLFGERGHGSTAPAGALGQDPASGFAETGRTGGGSSTRVTSAWNQSFSSS